MKTTIRIERSNGNELLLLVPFAIYLFASLLSTSFYYKYFDGTPYRIIVFVCIGVLLIREIINTNSSKSVIAALIILSLSLVITKNTSGYLQVNVLALFIFVFSCRNVNISKILVVSLIISLFVLVIVLLSSYIGIIDNYERIQNGKLRHYLGFRYSLYPQAIYFNIVAIYVYLKKQNISLLSMLVIVLFDYYLYVQTYARLSSGLTIILVLVAMILKCRPDLLKRQKIVSFFLVLSYIICCILSVYMIANYDSGSEWQKSLNELLNGRLRLGKLSFEMYGVSLFGKNITWVGNGLDVYGNRNREAYLYVDCLYAQILQRYGIVFTLVIIAIQTVTIYECIKREDYYGTLILAVLAFHGIIDDLIFYLHYNVFWILSGVYILGKKRNFANKKAYSMKV